VTWRHVVSHVLLAGGVGLCLLSVLGVIVMRGVYDRLHYVGLAGFGALLAALGIVVQESFSVIGDKALATAAVLLAGGPIVMHATARSARIREHGDWRAPGPGGSADHVENGR
jgi:multisubunit Na+/H+ antiporter MnhG subunit